MRDFSISTAVNTSIAGSMGLILGWGTKILQSRCIAWPKKKKKDSVCELLVSETACGLCVKVISSWTPAQIYWNSIGTLQSACWHSPQAIRMYTTVWEVFHCPSCVSMRQKRSYKSDNKTLRDSELWPEIHTLLGCNVNYTHLKWGQLETKV